MTSFGSVGFGRLDTTLATVGSETQTHGICAPVQTPVVGSESRVPEEEPKLVVKTDLGFQVKPTFSSVSKNVLEEWRTPYARDKQRAKRISSADTSGVLSWQVQRLAPHRLPMEYHMAFSFWIWFPEVECRLPYFLDTWNSDNFVSVRENFVGCDINNYGSNGCLVDNVFSLAKKTSICTENSYIHTRLLVAHVKSSATL